jgi:hypothetical protein
MHQPGVPAADSSDNVSTCQAVVTQVVISVSGVNIFGVRVYALARGIPASNGARVASSRFEQTCSHVVKRRRPSRQ